MADIAIITGATGGIGMEFVKAIHPSEDQGSLPVISDFTLRLPPQNWL